MSHLYFIFGKGGGGYDAHQITPVNNIAFVLCIWKGRYSLKQKINPVNNAAWGIDPNPFIPHFYLALSVHYLIPYLYTTSWNYCHFST